MIRSLFLLIALFMAPQALLAASDPRMDIEVVADEANTVEALHANIRMAADMALPQLWQRIIPQAAQGQIPENLKAVRFLLRAAPSENGVAISFSQRRVMAYLEQNSIPHLPEQPHWNLAVELSSSSGRAMPQSAAMLEHYAADAAKAWGFATQGGREALVLHWHWLDSSQVELSVRGTSRLGEFSESRMVTAGDPFLQLKPWLTEVLLKARDTYASNAMATPATDATPEIAAAAQLNVMLTIERQASLPEQVLFEEELLRDPRVLDISLRQVNRDGQRYQLTLKGDDDQWLPLWFNRRGLSLSSGVEGWVAR